jgi:hypothetical protein
LTGVSDLFEQPEDATPLTPEEMRELIPAYIAYRRELNEAEQENIARAQDWALNCRRDPLNEKFVNLGVYLGTLKESGDAEAEPIQKFHTSSGC